MYFETPVLKKDRKWAACREEDYTALWTCWEGLDAWFKEIADTDELVVCFSTEPVEGAVKSTVDKPSGLTGRLVREFRERGIRTYQLIWWWVEIVTDE